MTKDGIKDRPPCIYCDLTDIACLIYNMDCNSASIIGALVTMVILCVVVAGFMKFGCCCICICLKKCCCASKRSKNYEDSDSESISSSSSDAKPEKKKKKRAKKQDDIETSTDK